MAKVYEKGTVKVVWIEDDAKKIYSKMFESVDEAEEFAKEKKDCLIFKLIKQEGMKDFEWEMLEFGKYATYKKLFKAYRKFNK